MRTIENLLEELELTPFHNSLKERMTAIKPKINVEKENNNSDDDSSDWHNFDLWSNR